MSFTVAQKTLERLEWPRIVERLRDQCRTPQARRGLLPAADEAAACIDPSEAHAPFAMFAATTAELRERLTRTSEARALLDVLRAPGLGGLSEIEPSLARARKGGVLAASELREIGGALATLHETARELAACAEDAPALADLAGAIGDHRELEREIDWCIDPAGEVRDQASRVLREARADSRRLSGELKQRLEGLIRNPDVRDALSDDYVTVRNDRYVLPVRSEMRSKVRGIVHDASNSGTTIFVEPEGVVELNNRLKQAEIDAAREIERILRQLSGELAEAAPALRASLRTLVEIDLAFARGRVSQAMEAVEPVLDERGVFELEDLRHPLLPPQEAVPNDIHLGDEFHILVVSGPNAGGKTVVMKAVGLALLLARAGMHVPAAPGARVALLDTLLADIGDEQDIRESLSTFSAHMTNLARIVASASPRALAVLDEIGVGTDPGEGAAIAQSILEALADAGARVIATTHYNLLKEMAEVDERFRNASVQFDPQTLAPTYRLHLGTAGASSATAVAARMGMPSGVLDRANALLDREDRQLDRMLGELAASRAALEQEQRELTRLRAESEAERDRYRAKLERLQERRDALFQSMRTDLDRAFQEAHGEVASVIRELQRKGTAQQAARARGELEKIAERSQQVASELGVESSAEAPGSATSGAAVDWQHARPGDAVLILSGGNRVTGVLEALPDRRGRVAVRAATARLLVPAERVRTPESEAASRPRDPARVQLIRAGGERHEDDLPRGGSLECDLRGMRVREALDKLDESLDRAAAEACDLVRVIHGIGTGALRSAVREHLATSPLVRDLRCGDPEQGGEGVTEAELA